MPSGSPPRRRRSPPSERTCWRRSTRCLLRRRRTRSPRSAASCGRAWPAAERVESELRRCRDRLDQLDARGDELDRLRDQYRHDCKAAELLESPLIDDMERAEAHTARAQAALDAAVEARQQAAETASSCSARVEALQMALDVAHARAGAEHLADLEGVRDGVLGTLLDLVRIEEGWEPAVEAALGEALAGVVVADPATASRALAALRQSDTNGAVLALGLDPGPAAWRVAAGAAGAPARRRRPR